MTIIFDGNDYAQKKKLLLQQNVNLLREKGIIPHLATILIGSDTASNLYVSLKKKFLESIGCQVDIYSLNLRTKFEEIELLINSLNEDISVHGIMVQFPLPKSIEIYKTKIINLISNSKDVDGLQKDSLYLHPTSKAVMEILAIAIFETKKEVKTVYVAGSTGMVGRPLVMELKRLGYLITDKTDNADCVISATGVSNLITPQMIMNNQIAIDVGSPKGDINPLVKDKAIFFTPVPGGVGPVTITCLAENLIIASDKN